MPFITYTKVEDAISADQKAAYTEALTNAVTQTLGEKLRSNVWVTLNEVPEGDFSIVG